MKDVGKKLGQILPGLVGAIASFIFKTAGEAIGFLAKNAYLLILAVVIYFAEKFKKENDSLNNNNIFIWNESSAEATYDWSQRN